MNANDFTAIELDMIRTLAGTHASSNDAKIPTLSRPDTKRMAMHERDVARRIVEKLDAEKADATPTD